MISLSEETLDNSGAHLQVCPWKSTGQASDFATCLWHSVQGQGWSVAHVFYIWNHCHINTKSTRHWPADNPRLIET